MKVFNLHCDQEHVFEGWFGSEADFQSQMARALVSCPVCNSAVVRKGLSAPRLNLGATDQAAAKPLTAKAAQAPLPAGAAENPQAAARAQQAAWLQASRHVMQHTEDVGDAFAQEARRIHHGEAQERAIRGQTTAREAMALIDEGIEVMPLMLPEAAKNTLQ